MLGLFLASLMFQQGVWGSIPPIPEARQEVGVIATEGRVYVIGGLVSGGGSSNRVDFFDVAGNEWHSAPPLPINVHHPMVAAVGAKIYVAGGYTDPGFTPHARTYEFDPDISVWTRKADMPTARGAGAATAYAGKVYVFGGERNGTSVTEAASFDPATNIWTPLPPMPTPRNHIGSALARGKIYVIGGRPFNLPHNEAFDPTTQIWTTKAPMPTPRSGIAAASVGSYVYVLGGEGNPNSPAGTFEENEAYDVDADQWTTEKPMPLPRHGIGAGVIGNRIYVPAGGPVAGYSVTAQSDFFEVAQQLVLPQFVVGGGYRSEIVVSNPASRPAEIEILLTDINGGPLNTTLDGAFRSTLSFSLPALASRTILAPDNSGPLRAGTVRITGSARITAFAVIRAAGLPATPVHPVASARSGIFHVRFRRNQTNTGVAISNQSTEAASLILTLINESGAEVSRIERTIPAGTQLSRFISELFPGSDQTDFAGTMAVRSTQPVVIVALAISIDGVVVMPITPIE